MFAVEARYLTADELDRLRDQLTDSEWLPCAVALETGLRIGDVVALESRSLVGSKILYKAAKTGKAGEAELSPMLAAAVMCGASSRWLFPSPYNSGHITRQTVWARLKRAAIRAGIDSRGVSPHSLRKAYAVRLCRDAGLEAVRVALQHERTDTAEIYALSDWLTGANADEPLRRRDLDRIVEKIIEVLSVKA